MADLFDVENTLVTLISNQLYPNGTTQPSIVPSANTISIYAGWPRPADIEAALKANDTQVTVFPSPGTVRNTTRYERVWQQTSLQAATLTLTVSDNTVTVGGTVSTPQTCILIVNNIAYAYDVLNVDTLDSIAAALAALIPGAVALANEILIPNVSTLIARISQYGQVGMEINRQEQLFQIITWASTPQVRSAVGSAIKSYLDYILRFDLPDGFGARIIYKGTYEYDQYELTRLYRRDLRYIVEYPTTLVTPAQTLEQIITEVAIDGNDVNPVVN
jgi:hypothetical protein